MGKTVCFPQLVGVVEGNYFLRREYRLRVALCGVHKNENQLCVRYGHAAFSNGLRSNSPPT